MGSGSIVGTAFAGYRVESVLGRGGMSVVYLAEHPRLKNRVALKLLAPALAHDTVFRERLARESQLAASLNHPNVIPVFDTGEEDGTLFISMRYVDGVDLRELLQAGPLPLEHTASVIAQAASALDAAHARGLVHRDVKPANILIERGSGEPGHVYVADFGLTKHADAHSGATASGVVGTVHYMAPEQIEGRQVDARADVYSLGCVLYQCLTGKPPFELANDVAVLWAHIRTDPPLPGEANRALRAFDGIVDRALAKNPGERYESCGALAADVGRAANVRKRTARGALPRPRSRARRRWLVPALVGAVLGAAAAAAFAVAVRDEPAQRPTVVRRAAPPDPSVLRWVPPALRHTCRAASPPTPNFDASVVCTPTDPNVTSVRYSHASSGTRMRQQLVEDAWSLQIATPGAALEPTGSCAQPGSPAVRDWVQLSQTRRLERLPDTPGSVRGRLLCYTSPYGWSELAWTDRDRDMYSVAYGRSRYGLTRWWRVRGGLTD